MRRLLIVALLINTLLLVGLVGREMGVFAQAGAGGPATDERFCADANGDGAIDLSDAVTILNHLFTGQGTPPYCIAQEISLASMEDRLVKLAERVDALAEKPSLSPEHEEILGHIGLVELPDGRGGQTKTIQYSGVNLQIVNGEGKTATANGAGNLIIGYQEARGAASPDPDNTRTGSHNLVVGAKHSYRSYGGLVAGFHNTVSGPHASVSGGAGNRASGLAATVSGGAGNLARSSHSVSTERGDEASRCAYAALAGSDSCPPCFALVDESTLLGRAEFVSGGAARGRVGIQRPLPGEIDKAIESVTYDELTLRTGLSMEPGFYDWINSSLTRQFERRDGSILVCDSAARSLERRDFREGLITEITIPALDARDSGRGALTVKIAPETVQVTPGDRSVIQLPRETPARAWRVPNFRVELGSLPTDDVVRVDSLTATVAGGEGGPLGSPPELAVSNLGLTMVFSKATFDEWRDWSLAFVTAAGQSDAEVSGGVKVFAPDQTELFVIHLAGVGLVSLALDSTDTDASGAQTFRVELYVESMNLEIK